MKEIILPTDFSDDALNAIFTAIKLQRKTPCHFVLLHVYKPDTRNSVGLQKTARVGMIYDSLHQESLSKLEETLNIIAKVSDYEQHSFSVKTEPGDLATVISEYVPKYDLDLIVMGTKGATGAKKVFFGSNTINVLKKIRNCPILVVPTKFNFQSLRRIVFPTNFTNFFSKGQLQPFILLAQAWRSQILVFYAAQAFDLTESQLSNKKVLKERLGSIKHSCYNEAIDTNITEAITEFANDQLADMICLVHYRHTFMEKLTQEPVVKNIGFYTKLPLLVLPE